MQVGIDQNYGTGEKALTERLYIFLGLPVDGRQPSTSEAMVTDKGRNLTFLFHSFRILTGLSERPRWKTVFRYAAVFDWRIGTQTDCSC